MTGNHLTIVNRMVIVPEGHSGDCGGEKRREEDTNCEVSPQNSGKNSRDEKREGNQEVLRR